MLAGQVVVCVVSARGETKDAHPGLALDIRPVRTEIACVTLLRFRGANHPQQVKSRGVSEDVDARETHWTTFDPLHARFGFTLDAAATAQNAKLPRFVTPEENGLARAWYGERVWCNPPYSNIGPWVEHAWDEWRGTMPPELVVMILPANRTEQGWWQRLVEPFRDRAGSDLRTEFIAGRTRFIRAGAPAIFPNERPPFGCVLLIWQHAAPSLMDGKAIQSRLF